ncbi:cation diffusion facilitator CzcD-associated flavoprotein CzcO [Actinomycetospora cinnamomea]|uniref:Cation diffusion facilitator CzcD-associated flavoprotein CzcO n=1 Tax=Actinomycetospora cinnamomea TaxID=663609 RepID=A0A2U1FSK1_9PSEU|nr:cation diffusion facilitator CzcD-associated flavoprotein CzcO [Actinomycetospora cinnamomea]
MVVGAGFAGLAVLHLLRERGLRVRAFDAAGDVGGTWWWHAYPGSRLDTECDLYQYSFSESLYRDWGWSERYPAGYEVQRWFRFVADRLDLRRDIALSTTVTAARYDDGAWTVRTDRDDTVRTPVLVTCTGRLPVEPGLGTGGFSGTVLRTASWREDGHDLAGLRVGVVGTTAAAIQLVPAVVDRVAGLTVVADRARDVVARSNPVYGWREREDYRARFAELRDAQAPAPPASDRAAMRARLGDERLAEVLVPHGGPGPVARDSGWLEAFGRDHVRLVRSEEVARVGPTGLELTDGAATELDVLVVTDDPDAGPPAREYLGLPARHPALFTVTASGAAPCRQLERDATRVAGAAADLVATGPGPAAPAVPTPELQER